MPLSQPRGMLRKTPLLVFTDLDGTLIDHDTYSAAAAFPALTALKSVGAAVIMASSKTAPEISSLQEDLDLTHWPAIVENGAGLLLSDGADSSGKDYIAIRAALDKVPQDLRRFYRGFGDMTVAEIAQTTGLPYGASAMAAKRQFSEPGLWRGDDDQRRAFLAALDTLGIAAREGGRFLTLSFGQTKADHMADVIAEFAPLHTVALGDAPNDIEMLEAADFGVIVANPHRRPLPLLRGEKEGRIIRTLEVGPAGWNTAILDLLARLNLTKEDQSHG